MKSQGKTSKFAGLISAAAINTALDNQPGLAQDQLVPKRKAESRQGRRSNPDYVQISAYVNKRLYRRVQKALLDQDKREVSQLLEDLLAAWIDAGAPGPPE